MIDTSDQGLVEKPSPVEGGGMMVELDGRFQNTVVVDGDSVECVPDSQAAAEAAAAQTAAADAAAAQDGWRRMTGKQRGIYLRKIAAMIERRREEIARTMLPEGVISFNTFATDFTANDVENEPGLREIDLAPALRQRPHQRRQGEAHPGGCQICPRQRQQPLDQRLEPVDLGPRHAGETAGQVVEGATDHREQTFG